MAPPGHWLGAVARRLNRRMFLSQLLLQPDLPASRPSGSGVPVWAEDRAEKLLFQGKRVVVDATFREERKRRDFLELASRLAVPAAFLVCQADPQVVRLRLGARRGDVSDADWSVYRKAVEQWEEQLARLFA